MLIKASVLLQNLVRKRYQVMQNKLLDWERPNGVLVLGPCREGRNIEDTMPNRVLRPNRDVRLAKAQRNRVMQ
ncbi:hypothetical protein DPMN_130895 [Dreissena polymorpha]|uniref:Uncharacterized protein n=1 Tax=Dreissena polymorpha TaxID=45954 RepID=A0A9D4H5I1_DREPO|nr:hypothetical protein DPMN_130895 [Dreissena polymorpha]